MNNINEIHFFDLDGTLWDMSVMIWIIDKEDPSKPLMKLTFKEYFIIRNGVYKKDDNKIDYNGIEYFISDILFNKLKKIKKSLILERIGFSFIELLDNKYINKIKYNVSNIYHLRNKSNVHIGLLTARWDQKKDAPFLNELRIILKDLSIDIDKIYFVSDYIKYKSDTSSGYAKLNILLEHLIGYKIDKNKFVSLIQDQYNSVYFYDDDVSNINIANDTQSHFDELMLNTEDEVFFKIREKMLKDKLILTTNWISNNSYNRFLTTTIELKPSIKYPLKIESKVLSYDKFILEKLNFKYKK